LSLRKNEKKAAKRWGEVGVITERSNSQFLRGRKSVMSTTKLEGCDIWVCYGRKRHCVLWRESRAKVDKKPEGGITQIYSHEEGESYRLIGVRVHVMRGYRARIGSSPKRTEGKAHFDSEPRGVKADEKNSH